MELAKEIVTTVILSIVGAVISGIGAFVMAWIRSKIKNEKAAKIIDDAYRIVHEGVSYVYQTYVDNLKGTDLWDDIAKETAKQKAVEYINKNLSIETVKFLEQNGTVLKEWIAEQIEIAVQQQK
jgi:accessory colonization factor AcfC